MNVVARRVARSSTLRRHASTGDNASSLAARRAMSASADTAASPAARRAMYRAALRLCKQSDVLGWLDKPLVFSSAYDFGRWGSGMMEPVSSSAVALDQLDLDDIMVVADANAVARAAREIAEADDADGAQIDLLHHLETAVWRARTGTACVARGDHGVVVAAVSDQLEVGDDGQSVHGYKMQISALGRKRDVQLVTRGWLIYDDKGELVAEVPRGSPGVVGETPVFTKDAEEAFVYHSGSSIPTSTGRMAGCLGFVDLATNTPFDVDFGTFRGAATAPLPSTTAPPPAPPPRPLTPPSTSNPEFKLGPAVGGESEEFHPSEGGGSSGF